jgi:hypothetical protein
LKGPASDRESLPKLHVRAATCQALCWIEAPLKKVRDRILKQSADMIGVAPILGIRDRIVRLLLRHRKA